MSGDEPGDMLGQSLHGGEYKALLALVKSDDFALLIERVLKPLVNDLAMAAVKKADPDELLKLRGKVDLAEDIVNLPDLS